LLNGPGPGMLVSYSARHKKLRWREGENGGKGLCDLSEKAGARKIIRGSLKGGGPTEQKNEERGKSAAGHSSKERVHQLIESQEVGFHGLVPKDRK